MFKLRIAIGVASSLVAVAALTIVLAGTGQAQGNGNGLPSGPNVVVVNTPLPVTGTVTATIPGNVNVTGQVNAVQSGAWNVGITGVASIRNLDERGRSPYATQTIFGTTTMSCFTTGGGFQDCELRGFERVPAGKRLVIQDFSGVISEPAGCKPYIVSVDGYTSVLALPRPALVVADSYEFHDTVLNFVDAGSAPVVTIHSSCAGLNVNSQFVAITGYLVDVP